MAEYSTLLLAKEENKNSFLAQRLFASTDVTYTTSPEEFLNTLKTSDVIYSAFIIDATAFRKDAIRLVMYIRQIDQCSYTPIFLVIDDLNDEDVLEAGSVAGATDVLVRPYTPYVHRRVMNTIRMNEASRQLEQSYEDLVAAREDMNQFLDRMPGGLFRYLASFTPGEDALDYVSPGLVHMMGCETEEELRDLCDNTFSGLVHPDDIGATNQSIKEQIQHGSLDKVTYRVIDKQGNVKWFEDWGRLVEDNLGIKWFYVVVLDITEKMEKAQTLQTQAEIDGLTGVYNRPAAIAHIEALRSKKNEPCSLMLMDVDNFKGINDNYGHPFGDEVLVALAQFLKNTVRGGDVVTRLGGDEFAVFVMGLGEGPRLNHLVRRISETAFEDFCSDAERCKGASPSVSIGVASAPDSSMPIDELYALADGALYETKRAGKNGYCFAGENGELVCKPPQ